MTVRMWDVNMGAALATLWRDEDGVISVEFSADGTHIISRDYNGLNRTWNVREYLTTPTDTFSDTRSSVDIFPVFFFQSDWLLAQVAADTIPC